MGIRAFPSDNFPSNVEQAPGQFLPQKFPHGTIRFSDSHLGCFPSQFLPAECQLTGCLFRLMMNYMHSFRLMIASTSIAIVNEHTHLRQIFFVSPEWYTCSNIFFMWQKLTRFCVILRIATWDSQIPFITYNLEHVYRDIENVQACVTNLLGISS